MWVPSPSRTRDTPGPPISRNGGRGRGEKGPGSTPLTRCRARVLSPAALSVPAVEARVGSGTGGKSVHGSRRDGLLTDRGSDHLMAQTNPPVRGRVSADRSEEAAQPLTTPRLVRKSSTDDSVRLHCMWGLGAFGRVTPALPDATEVPLHGLRKDGSRHVP